MYEKKLIQIDWTVFLAFGYYELTQETPVHFEYKHKEELRNRTSLL